MPGLPYKSREEFSDGEKSLPHALIFPDLRSARTIYFYSILNRPEPERYDWNEASVTPYDFINKLDMEPELAKRIIGEKTIGSLIVFPHVFTDAIWNGGDRETNLYKKLFETAKDGEITLQELPNKDEHGILVGCPSVLVPYAIEAIEWSIAESVPDYLFRAAEFGADLSNFELSMEVLNPSKIEEFYNSEEQQKLIFEDKRERSEFFYIDKKPKITV